MTDRALQVWGLLSDMSDKIIDESIIPAEVAPVAAKRTRGKGRFSALMNHPAMVAVLCAVVSLGVVVAIVMAGRGGPVTPPVVGTPPVEETVTQAPFDSEPETNNMNQETSQVEVHVIATKGDSNHMVPEKFRYYEGYWKEDQPIAGEPMDGFRGKPEEVENLPSTQGCWFDVILLGDCRLQWVTVYDTKMNQMMQDHASSPLKVHLEAGTYYVVLQIFWEKDLEFGADQYVFALNLDEPLETLTFHVVYGGETNEPNDPIPADFASYESIIRMYHKMVEVLPDWAEKHEELETMFYFPNEQAREWYTRVGNAAFILCPGDRTNGVAHLGYAVKDANGDGVEELLLLSDEFTLIALFTQHDGKPVLLEDFWNRKRGYVNENGQIIICGSSGADVSSREIYRLDATTGQLVLEEALGLGGHTEDLQTIYYHQVGEEKTYISEEEFNEFIRKAPYDSYSTEKNRQVLGADYTPISMPVEVSVYFFVGMGGPKAEHIRIYTDPEKICACADFFTDVLVRSDPPEVLDPGLIGGTYWITLEYENGTTVTFADWGSYVEYENKWYQLDDKHYRVIDELFERYDSDVELSEVNIRVLAWDETGFCGEMDDTGKNVYIKGMSTDWLKKYDVVWIVYEVEKLAEAEGTVVNDTGETVTYQWVIEDPLSGWKTQ